MVGEGGLTKLVFLGGAGGSDDPVQAVALTPSQVDALVGMLTTYLDSGDPDAVGMF